jgi:hypothetical protein
MPENLIDEIYLPFTESQLSERFYNQQEGHLKPFRDSVALARKHADRLESGETPSRSEEDWARQIEKAESFWGAATLMAFFNAAQSEGDLSPTARLLAEANIPGMGNSEAWQESLSGELCLWFEFHFPAPLDYRDALRKEAAQRIPIPYLRNRVSRPRWRGENSTPVDALLFAPETGVAVAFEAKVLSDAGYRGTYDAERNQIARIIDVLLEKPKAGKKPPLDRRKVKQSYFVLLTPAAFRPTKEGKHSGSRLYTWLMEEYRRPGGELLTHHLRHRRRADVVDASQRIGWVTWEDCRNILPASCRWLVEEPSKQE